MRVAKASAALAKAKAQNKRTAAVARKGIAQTSAAAGRFKLEAARANTQACKARIGKLPANDVDTAAKVLTALLASLRGPR